MNKTVCWQLVIDTDSYSGNFHRDMGSYVVGCTGNDRFLALFDNEVELDEYGESPFSDLWMTVNTEFGPEVANLCPTEGWFNDGKGNHYRDDDPIAGRFARKFPCYQSVCIKFHTQPEPGQIGLMVERIEKFAEIYGSESFEETIRILDIRFERVVETVEAIVEMQFEPQGKQNDE